MDAKKLKSFCEAILTELEEHLNDIQLLSGYMYDHKKLNRLKSIHYDQLTKLTQQRFLTFQNEYEKRFNDVLDKTMKEMTSGNEEGNALSSKYQFWTHIHKNMPPETVIQRYLDAATSGNKAYMHFIENKFIQNITDENYLNKLQELIKKHKKMRISQSTQQELSELKSLYGFYIQSLKFTKNPKIDLDFLQDLFATMDRYLKIPLQELIAK